MVSLTVPIHEFTKVRKGYREALFVSDIDDDDLQAILTAPIPPESEALNHLMNGSSET